MARQDLLENLRKRGYRIADSSSGEPDRSSLLDNLKDRGYKIAEKQEESKPNPKKIREANIDNLRKRGYTIGGYEDKPKEEKPKEPSYLDKAGSFVKEEAKKIGSYLKKNPLKAAYDLSPTKIITKPTEMLLDESERIEPIVKKAAEFGPMEVMTRPAKELRDLAYKKLVPEKIQKKIKKAYEEPALSPTTIEKGADILEKAAPTSLMMKPAELAYEKAVPRKVQDKVSELKEGAKKKGSEFVSQFTTPEMVGELVAAGVLPPYAIKFLPGLAKGAREGGKKTVEAAKRVAKGEEGALKELGGAGIETALSTLFAKGLMTRPMFKKGVTRRSYKGKGEPPPEALAEAQKLLTGRVGPARGRVDITKPPTEPPMRGVEDIIAAGERRRAGKPQVPESTQILYNAKGERMIEVEPGRWEPTSKVLPKKAGGPIEIIEKKQKAMEPEGAIPVSQIGPKKPPEFPKEFDEDSKIGTNLLKKTKPRFDETTQLGLEALRGDISRATAGKRVPVIEGEGSFQEQNVIGMIADPSTFPIKDLGIPKKEQLKIMDKLLAGEKLTENQQVIADRFIEHVEDQTERARQGMPRAGGIAHPKGKVQEYIQKKGLKPLGGPSSITRVTQPATVRNVQGEKISLKKGEEFRAMPLSGNKYLVQDGEQFVATKGEVDKLKSQGLVLGENKVEGFEGTTEIVKGIPDKASVANYERYIKKLEDRANKFQETKGMTLEELRNAGKLFPEELKQLQEYEDAIKGQRLRDTKYRSYTQPGGENYREILVQAPIKGRADFNYDYEIQSLSRLPEQTPEIRERIKELKAEQKQLAKPTFKSSHWDEPNVLAHVRTTDRTTQDGKKILFVEELQSDWALEGRKKGFEVSEAKPKEVKVERDSEGHGYNVIVDGHPMAAVATRERALERANEFENKIFKRGVPYHPYLKNWQENTINQIMRRAAQEDYDGVAWASGQQVADFYDLSKRVDSVVWNGETNNLIAYKNGAVILESFTPKEKLAETIGKEAAEKLISQKPEKRLFVSPVTKPQNQIKYHITDREGRFVMGAQTEAEAIKTANKLNDDRTIQGADLKIEPAWAKNLYDKQIPNILNKMVKKWGGKVENIDLGESPADVDIYGDPLRDEGRLVQQSLILTPQIKEMVKTGGVPKAGGKIHGKHKDLIKPPTEETMKAVKEAQATIDKTKKTGLMADERGFASPDLFTGWVLNAEQVTSDLGKIGASLKKGYKHFYPEAKMRKIADIFDGGYNIAEYEAFLTKQEVEKMVPKKEDRIKVSHAIEGTGEADPEALAFVKDKFDQNYDYAKKNGLEVGFIDNYVTHVWEQPEKVLMAWDAYSKNLQRLTGKAREQKHRTIPTLKWGKEHGFTPKTEDAAELVAINEKSLKEAVVRSKMLQSLNDLGIIKPVDEVPAGSTDWVEIDNRRLVDTAPKGTRFAVKADNYQEIQNLVNPSKLKTTPVVGQALVIQAFGKRSLFELNPFFHSMALAKSVAYDPRDIRFWKGVEKYKRGDPIVKEALQYGVKIGPPEDVSAAELKGMTDAVMKRSKLLGILPKAAQRFADDILWNKVFLGFKVNTYESVSKKMVKKFGDKFDHDHLKRIAADYVNDVYGGLNNRRMMKNPDLLAFQRLLLLAPDWTFSNLRSGTGLFRGALERKEVIEEATGKKGPWARAQYWRTKGSPYFKYWRNILLTVGTLSQLLNMHNTKRDKGEARMTWDNPPERKWDVYLYQDDEGNEYYADLLGFLKDNMEMVTNTGEFFYRKGAHIPKMVYDQFRNEQWNGQPIFYEYDPGLTKLWKRAKYAGKAFMPISIKSLVEERRFPQPTWQKLVSTGGVPVRSYYPKEAQKYMGHLKIEKTETSKDIYAMLNNWDRGELSDEQVAKRVKEKMAAYNKTADRVLKELGEKYRFTYDPVDQKSWGKHFITQEKIDKGYKAHLKRKGKDDLARILGF